MSLPNANYPRAGEALPHLVRWYKEGRLKHRDTVVKGLEQAPATLNRLFDGDNIGERMTKIADNIAEPPLPLPKA